MPADQLFRICELLGVRLEEVISTVRRGLVPVELWLGELAQEDCEQLRLLKTKAKASRDAPVNVEVALAQLDELLRLGKPEAAETEPYLAALRKLEKEPGEEAEHLCLKTWELLGAVHRNSIHYSASAYCYREALRLSAGQPVERARLLRRACYLARDQGDFEQALYLAEQARGIYVEQRLLPDVGRSWVDSGRSFQKEGRLAEAIEAFTAGLQLLDDDVFYLISAHQGLGLCHAHRDALEAAHQHLRTAEEIHRRMPSGPRQLSGLYWLNGEIALREGELLNARLLFQEILAMHSCDSNPLEAAAASLRMAKIYLLLGETEALADLTAQVTLLLNSLERQPFAQAALIEFYRLSVERRLTAKSLDRLAFELLKLGRATR